MLGPRRPNVHVALSLSIRPKMGVTLCWARPKVAVSASEIVWSPDPALSRGWGLGTRLRLKGIYIEAVLAKGRGFHVRLIRTKYYGRSGFSTL